MKILFISLGCDKNLVDTEHMMGILRDNGYEFTDDEMQADVIVINTCCFINDAKEESINTILEMTKLKETAKCKALVVTGCLAQRYEKEIREEISEVDVLVGTTATDEIAAAINDALKGIKKNHFSELKKLPEINSKRIITNTAYSNYLKIAEGCNKRCTYCIIPHIRGNYRSVPMEKLLDEAKYLASMGTKELILVAQETTLYGIDLYGKKSLHVLLKELCKIDGIQWIRILYAYPEEIYDELIDTIRSEEKICKYIDMPIQHASDEILRKMGRKTNKEHLINVISKLRQEIPDIAIRTTLITGFPGETEEHHDELLDFIDEIEFDRLGVFTYSPEEGTIAAQSDNQIDENIKLDRRFELMNLQQEITFDKSQEMIGKCFDVLVEGKLFGENVYQARTYKDAPSVDGYVYINTDEEIMSGDFVKVKITGAYEYDLIAEIWRE